MHKGSFWSVNHLAFSFFSSSDTDFCLHLAMKRMLAVFGFRYCARFGPLRVLSCMDMVYIYLSFDVDTCRLPPTYVRISINRLSSMPPGRVDGYMADVSDVTSPSSFFFHLLLSSFPVHARLEGVASESDESGHSLR